MGVTRSLGSTALGAITNARGTEQCDADGLALTVWGGTTPGVAMPCSDEGDAAC